MDRLLGERPIAALVERHRGRLGHHVEGESHPLHVLTEADVIEMRRCRWETDCSYHVLADLYGVDSTTARMACVGATWKCVTAVPPCPINPRHRLAKPRGGERLLPAPTYSVYRLSFEDILPREEFERMTAAGDD